MHELTGRTAIVTGGASGIGFACAELLAERGAKVLACDQDPHAQSEARFAELGIVSRLCDVRNEPQVQSLVESWATEQGRLDILVNSAGVGCVGRITAITADEWDRCLDTNLKGSFLFCKHAIAAMQPTGGAIVNIASNAGILPRVHDPVYCISKAGVVMLTKSLALTHAPERIRVNAVCPGPVGGTRMVESEIAAAPDPQAQRQKLIDASPLARAHNRMTTPREVAAAVLYLVADESLMVTGTLIAIDGGKSIGVPAR